MPQRIWPQEAVLRIGRRALKNGAMVGIATAAFTAIFAFQVAFPVIILAAALGRPREGSDPIAPRPVDASAHARGRLLVRVESSNCYAMSHATHSAH